MPEPREVATRGAGAVLRNAPTDANQHDNYFKELDAVAVAADNVRRRKERVDGPRRKRAVAHVVDKAPYSYSRGPAWESSSPPPWVGLRLDY